MQAVRKFCRLAFLCRFATTSRPAWPSLWLCASALGFSARHGLLTAELLHVHNMPMKSRFRTRNMWFPSIASASRGLIDRVVVAMSSRGLGLEPKELLLVLGVKLFYSSVDSLPVARAEPRVAELELNSERLQGPCHASCKQQQLASAYIRTNQWSPWPSQRGDCHFHVPTHAHFSPESHAQDPDVH